MMDFIMNVMQGLLNIYILLVYLSLGIVIIGVIGYYVIRPRFPEWWESNVITDWPEWLEDI